MKFWLEKKFVIKVVICWGVSLSNCHIQTTAGAATVVINSAYQSEFSSNKNLESDVAKILFRIDDHMLSNEKIDKYEMAFIWEEKL